MTSKSVRLDNEVISTLLSGAAEGRTVNQELRLLLNLPECKTKKGEEMKVSEIKNKILSGRTNEIRGKCYFCPKEVDGMFWCFGCHHFICEECDTNAGEAIGKHNVQKHQEQ